MDVLTVVEQSELAQHEATIERGLKTFVEVGFALMAIRDGRLYRQNHGTFEAYCQGRWGFTRMRASQLIAAAEVAQNVNNCLQIPPPMNEAERVAKMTIEVYDRWDTENSCRDFMPFSLDNPTKRTTDK